MIPSYDVQVDPSIPRGATFWVPKPSEIGEEGFGGFRDVWAIVGAHSSCTAEVLEAEVLATEYADRNANDAREFDAIAKLVESIDVDDLPDDAPAFMQAPNSGWTGLGGLELGVAGLVIALSNASFYPAASCRSHPESRWSPYPVVLFAASKARIEMLQPLVEEAGCGLDNSHSSDLFAVYAPSISGMMNLAANLFRTSSRFRKLPTTTRKQRPNQPQT